VESKERCSSSQPLWMSGGRVLVDHIADKLFGRQPSSGEVFVHVANDLSAEQPHIVQRGFGWFFSQAGLGAGEGGRA